MKTLKSTYPIFQETWVHKFDPALDFKWNRHNIPKQKEIRFRLEEPWEVGAKMQARLLIADYQRHQWEAEYQARRVAEIKSKYAEALAGAK